LGKYGTVHMEYNTGFSLQLYILGPGAGLLHMKYNTGISLQLKTSGAVERLVHTGTYTEA
jgi:hypothetical protein